MASSCGLRAHPGAFFVEILEQMSMVNFMYYSLGTTAEGLCLLMLLSRTISTLIFFSVNSTKERKKQVRITRPNSFIPGPCLRDKEREWGRASILSVMPNVAPDSTAKEISNQMKKKGRKYLQW